MKNIMFNDKCGLTQAVLDGRKTMTRRIVKGELPLGNWEETEKHAHYKVGDIVAIAQAYKDIYKDAYHIGLYGRTAGWTNKMFVRADDMPHHIKITNIRLERLQDISDDDCLKEGVNDYTCTFGIKKRCNGVTVFEETYLSPLEAFASLIDKVSGKGTWDSNQLVWVYEFELVD